MSAAEQIDLEIEGAAGPFKRCACGRCFTFSDWQQLEGKISYVEDDEGHGLYDWRNCPQCNSTLMVPWVLP